MSAAVLVRGGLLVTRRLSTPSRPAPLPAPPGPGPDRDPDDDSAAPAQQPPPGPGPDLDHLDLERAAGRGWAGEAPCCSQRADAAGGGLTHRGRF